MSHDIQQITIKLPGDTVESLADVATEQYGGNRSETIRDLIIKGLTADDRATEYEQRIEELERERDRFREQLAATNQRVDEHQELVEYVETERTLSERRAQAGVLTRVKWWLTGMPADTDSDGE